MSRASLTTNVHKANTGIENGLNYHANSSLTISRTNIKKCKWKTTIVQRHCWQLAKNMTCMLIFHWLAHWTIYALLKLMTTGFYLAFYVVFLLYGIVLYSICIHVPYCHYPAFWLHHYN